MGVIKKPWERRLKDLGQLLLNCAETYFDPDLFRLNTNQFLQTSRTVTFIIQKNKSSICDFDTWYKKHVLEAWQNDAIMQWAKSSRNIIEKEGDLELHSTLQVTLIYSYLAEEDVIIRVGVTELLHAGIKKLIRLAQRQLPTGVTDAAALRIERHWVSANLPGSELLRAMVNVYSRIEACCRSLAEHLGSDYEASNLKAEDMNALYDAARRVRYMKVRDRAVGSFRGQRMYRDPNFSPPPEVQEVVAGIKNNKGPISNLDGAVGFVEMMAEITFQVFKSHVPMLFMFDENWEIASSMSVEFSDQADKYIFWRRVADNVTTLKIAGLVWVSESWIRDLSSYPEQPIRKLPIKGETLHVVGLDRDGALLQKTWRIIRSLESGVPELENIESEEPFMHVPFYLVPAMRAMGIEDPLNKKTQAFVRAPK